MRIHALAMYCNAIQYERLQIVMALLFLPRVIFNTY